jgi:hypothetical protein
LANEDEALGANDRLFSWRGVGWSASSWFGRLPNTATRLSVVFNITFHSFEVLNISRKCIVNSMEKSKTTKLEAYQIYTRKLVIECIFFIQRQTQQISVVNYAGYLISVTFNTNMKKAFEISTHQLSSSQYSNRKTERC